MNVQKKLKKDENIVQTGKDTFTTNQRFASVAAFPAAVTFALALAYFAPQIGIPAEIGVFIVFVTSVAAVVFLERFVPRDISWRTKIGRDTRVDGTSLAVVMGVVDPALKGAWPLIAAAILSWVGYSGGTSIFPSTWPFLPKLAIAVLVAGFGEYWLHRLAP